jgi:hypothetical protein
MFVDFASLCNVVDCCMGMSSNLRFSPSRNGCQYAAILVPMRSYAFKRDYAPLALIAVRFRYRLTQKALQNGSKNPTLPPKRRRFSPNVTKSAVDKVQKLKVSVKKRPQRNTDCGYRQRIMVGWRQGLGGGWFGLDIEAC